MDDIKKYQELIDNEDQDGIKNAFVVFRSMEGAARLIQAYNKSRINLCCVRFCCCCVNKKEYKRKLFIKKWLKVSQAVEPSLINWENLGLSRKARCCRITFATIVALILLFLTTIAILYAKVQENALTKDAISCGKDLEITQEEAYQDVLDSEGKRSNVMFCYCQRLFWDLIAEKKSPYDEMQIEFPDGKKYCLDWFKDYSLSKSLLYLVPFSIIFVNWISKTILRLMARFYGYQSKPEEVLASAVNMFLMSFINSGIVIQLVYFQWLPGTDLPLILNEYSSFSQQWYQEVGTTIVVTLMLITFTPHISNLLFQLLGACGRCVDRGCSCDDRRTKQLVQEDYEDKNTGAEFMFEFRYSNILTVLAVAFLYSGGLPIMYPVAAFFFLITYWMDKCLLFNCYRKPIKFDNYLAKGTIGYFKFILLGHVAGFLLMFSMTPILQNDLLTVFEQEEFGTIG